MGRETRDEWKKRIQRWAESGLTAKEFAAETGINAHTLTHWKWKIAADLRAITEPTAKFVEVVPVDARVTCPPAEDAAPFEVLFADGRRLRVPPRFELASLGSLLELLGGR